MISTSLIPLSGLREVGIEHASHIFLAQRFMTLELPYNEVASFKVNPYNNVVMDCLHQSFLFSFICYFFSQFFFLLLVKANVNKKCPFHIQHLIFSRRESLHCCMRLIDLGHISGYGSISALEWKCRSVGVCYKKLKRHLCKWNKDLV